MISLLQKVFNIKRLLILIGVLGTFAILALVFSFQNTTNETTLEEDTVVGAVSYQGERGGNWYIYDTFSGFQTKYDATKINDGANPNGQNTTINDGDRISLRNEGYELFPTTATYADTANPITSMHVFRTRDGENILMRSYGTVVEYFEEANDTWETLKGSYTSGYKFGFADYNINTDLVSYVYFGNSQEQGRRWTGIKTVLTSAITTADKVIPVSSTAGFTASGNIVFCGTEQAYASITANTFTLSVSSTVACDDDRGVTEASSALAGHPRGNIYMTADNRLWIAGVTSTPQAAYFSKYGDATNFTTTTLITDNTDTSSGIFNLGEGGGAITAMIQDENAIYLMKRSIIRKATLSDTLYTLSTLKPFDGKSQTVGSVGDMSTFTSGNEVFFITPDNQILKLGRVENVDYPQLVPISDTIKPTVDDANFDSAVGIVFRNKAYFAIKSNKDTGNNDTVLVYNLQTNTWDSPIVGWAVSDFAIYDGGNGEELYWSDAITPNVYKVVDGSVDYIYDITANWRSKQFNFGMPGSQKIIDNVYVEGYISPNTELTISLLLDEDGYTQRYTTELAGTENTYIFASDSYNLFGFHPFGFERFGSNEDQSGKKKFRVYLAKSFTPMPFYNAQIEFASDQSGGAWEVTSFGFNIKPFTQGVRPSLMRDFK